jgi:hypothetical protein
MKKKLEMKNTEVIPKKNHLIVQNEHRIELIEGQSISVPNEFLETLITEKVIEKVRVKDGIIN